MRTLTGPRSAHDRRTLEERARALRDAPTASEELLWRALRGRRLGVTFRQQVLIGRYSGCLHPRLLGGTQLVWTFLLAAACGAATSSKAVLAAAAAAARGRRRCAVPRLSGAAVP